MVAIATSGSFENFQVPRGDIKICPQYQHIFQFLPWPPSHPGCVATSFLFRDFRFRSGSQPELMGHLSLLVFDDGACLSNGV